MTDSELKRQIETALHRETRLQGRDIDVAVEGGTIVLKGRVNEVAEKRLAVNLVRQMGDVRDQLRLLTTSEMTDQQILLHVKDAWMGDRAIHDTQIDAAVSDGVVTITGTLDNLEEKRLAGVLAWWVPGVTDVDNRIEVKPEQDGTDGDMLDAIRAALEKDPLVTAENVGVTALNGQITLAGSVNSEDERMAAEHDAYYVWGVTEVINRLSVNPR